MNQHLLVGAQNSLVAQISFSECGDIIRRGAGRRMQQCHCQLIFVGNCRDNRIKIAEQDKNCRDVTVTVAPGHRINFIIQQLR